MKIVSAVLIAVTAMVSSGSVLGIECKFGEKDNETNIRAELKAHEFDLKVLALLKKNREAKKGINESAFN